MFDLDSRGEILWVVVERGLWRQHFFAIMRAAVIFPVIFALN
jgi:hypothetical protein